VAKGKLAGKEGKCQKLAAAKIAIMVKISEMPPNFN
jgi:hypothetical protein